LGVFIATVKGTDGRTHRMVSHPGEISGFRSENWIVPDLRTALVVLTNAEYSSAASDIGTALSGLIGVATPGQVAAKSPAELHVRDILLGMAKGTIDHSQLTADASSVFTPQALDDIRYGLAAAGALRAVKLLGTQYRGGLTHNTFSAEYELATLQVDEYLLPSGQIEEFFLDAPR